MSHEDPSSSVNLKDFNIIERLGKGSFGSVYLVEKKSNQEIHAMKVLEKEKILKQNLVRYAMTERNVLCLAKHPFIVSLNYAFQTSNKLYLIVDYCPGGDMGMALSKQKRFTEEVARMYLCEIILAIEYLHQNNIVFRDLKPDNVVFDEDGHALLTDFGLSKEGLGGT
jgi:serine/threonine protein kinase